MSEPTDEQVRTALGDHRWIFAKTMADNPHEYTLLREWPKPTLFLSVVQYMREHGYETAYRGRKYVQFDSGGYFHWTMGAPLDKTILINRKRVGGYTTEQVEAMRNARR